MKTMWLTKNCVRTSPQSTMTTSSTGRSLLPFAASSAAWSEHRIKRILNGLTNLVDDIHALEDFSEHNLKRMSIREEDLETVV
jgi:hypothetical protein